MYLRKTKQIEMKFEKNINVSYVSERKIFIVCLMNFIFKEEALAI